MKCVVKWIPLESFEKYPPKNSEIPQDNSRTAAFSRHFVSKELLLRVIADRERSRSGWTTAKLPHRCQKWEGASVPKKSAAAVHAARANSAAITRTVANTVGGAGKVVHACRLYKRAILSTHADYISEQFSEELYGLFAYELSPCEGEDLSSLSQHRPSFVHAF